MFVRLRLAPLSLVVLLLSGCTVEQPTSEFCRDYRDAWNRFVSVRESSTAKEEVFLAREELQGDWDELAARKDAPDDVTGMVTEVSAAFTQAWNATSESERNGYEIKWENSHGYIEQQCKKSGHELEFTGLDTPLKPPAG